MELPVAHERSSTIRRALPALLRPWLWNTRPLRKADMAQDPIEQFAVWFRRAQRCWWLQFPEAACLCTVTHNGYPDGRMVLLKHFDQRGFVFYTNTLSTKGRSLQAVPHAALTFYWEPLQRQVRIQGSISQVSDKEADEYFATRLRLSQLSAWASKQSQVLDKRDILTERMGRYREKFRNQPVPRPPHWHGYRIIAQHMLFWRLRPGRLHDRFAYTRMDESEWKMVRLYP